MKLVIVDTGLINSYQIFIRTKIKRRGVGGATSTADIQLCCQIAISEDRRRLAKEEIVGSKSKNPKHFKDDIIIWLSDKSEHHLKGQLPL